MVPEYFRLDFLLFIGCARRRQDAYGVCSVRNGHPDWWTDSYMELIDCWLASIYYCFLFVLLCMHCLDQLVSRDIGFEACSPQSAWFVQ